ncbi:MAG: heme o synthase [Caulobacteraceae bacterium]
MTEALASSAPRAKPARSADYVALLKPRVMSLVVFTALTGLVCAGAPMNPVMAVIAVACIAVGAGASGALNMAYDSDIDALMRRTRGRPVPQGRISRADAAGFGVVLSLLSVMLMGLAVNWLAAGLLAFTIVFYALVYTVWLKRSTPQNIVIGGAAGALPPVVGWAAATGHVPLNAWLLFAIIFVWTPPHFWALSLYTTTDYAKAGVPMLPVVKGARATRRQIFAYSLLLAPLGVAPVFTGLGGPLYAAVSIGGGALFLLLATRVLFSHAGEAAADGPEGLYSIKPGAKTARDLFAVSILYLFALFAALLVEHGISPLMAHGI